LRLLIFEALKNSTMKFIIPALFICLTQSITAQYIDEQTDSLNVLFRPEIGVDGYFGASTNGGSFGLGLKYGIKLKENIIVGPSARILRTWSTFNGVASSFNIYGGGVFAHIRYGNVIFGGVEFEALKSPLNYSNMASPTKYIPTLFVGGGFSKEFHELVRVNAGIMYDVINHVNSPFRPSYTMKIVNSQTGEIQGYIPIIYRIAFFFPLGPSTPEVIEEF
jgi:hypothetical protein